MSDRHWVGNNASWNSTAGTKWSLTAGGAGGQAVPTSADDVYLDASSGTVTVTADDALNVCKSLICTGFTGTLAVTTFLAVNGSLTFAASMTVTPNASARFFLNGTSSFTITSAGKTMPGGVQQGGVGGTYTLQDALTVPAGSDISFRGGTFNANNFAVTSGSVNGATLAYTITMGSGTWTLLDAGTVWDLTSGTPTLNANTSTIKLTNNSASSKTFQGAGLTYNNFWNATSGSGVCIIAGSNVFNDVKADDGRTQQFTDGTTQTISSLTAVGTSSLGIVLSGTSTGGWTLSDSSGTNQAQYCTISYSTATGGANWTALAEDGNTDGGNNTGWDFGGSEQIIEILNLAA
jgi:hypothetical protein